MACPRSNFLISYRAQIFCRVCFDVWFFGVDADAGGEMFGFDFDELRRDLFAMVNRKRTARVEMTARRRIYRAGNIAD